MATTSSAGARPGRPAADDAGHTPARDTGPPRAGGTLRRLPVPVSQPPFDDEIGVAPPAGAVRRRTRRGGQVQGTLALAVVASADLVEPPPPDPADGAHPRPALPDPRRWTATLAQAALEGMHGRRSIQQLVRWTDEAVYKAIARRAAEQVATPAVRPRVRTIRSCQVTDTVAEVCVVVQLGTRVRAVAVRLEAVDDRWLCTAFDVVERPPARPSGRRPQLPAHAASNAEA